MVTYLISVQILLPVSSSRLLSNHSILFFRDWQSQRFSGPVSQSRNTSRPRAFLPISNNPHPTRGSSRRRDPTRLLQERLTFRSTPATRPLNTTHPSS
ncbi:uncharacterized protein B0T23DRAFT_164020 [Neurospora hispaniola]|uniref:Uncharacterized protein n=1 Tax=Neurospora hispaniola TaxID=588809 RepID=A0AAJ0MQ68_9PEZI|nr:hypothetical protein B0T23DRAFT_164020 [Neurospora hispaniola]